MKTTTGRSSFWCVSSLFHEEGNNLLSAASRHVFILKMRLWTISNLSSYFGFIYFVCLDYFFYFQYLFQHWFNKCYLKLNNYVFHLLSLYYYILNFSLLKVRPALWLAAGRLVRLECDWQKVYPITFQVFLSEGPPTFTKWIKSNKRSLRPIGWLFTLNAFKAYTWLLVFPYLLLFVAHYQRRLLHPNYF